MDFGDFGLNWEEASRRRIWIIDRSIKSPIHSIRNHVRLCFFRFDSENRRFRAQNNESVEVPHCHTYHAEVLLVSRICGHKLVRHIHTSNRWLLVILLFMYFGHWICVIKNSLRSRQIHHIWGNALQKYEKYYHKFKTSICIQQRPASAQVYPHSFTLFS